MITFQKFCESIDELSTNESIRNIFTQLNLIYQTKFLIYILQTIRNLINQSNNQIIINYYNDIYSILTKRYNNEELKQLAPNSSELHQYKIYMPDREQLEQIIDNIDANENEDIFYLAQTIFYVTSNAYSSNYYSTENSIEYAVANATATNNTSTSQYTQFAYNLLRIQNNKMKTINQIVQYNDTDNLNLDDLKIILDSLADQNYPNNDLIELLPNNTLRLKIFNITGVDNNDIVNQVNNLPPDYQTVIFNTIKQMYSL